MAVDINDLEVGDSSFGMASMPVIKKHLDRIFGTDKWIEWEPETLAIELGFIPDDLLHDKIQALQVLAQRPGIVHEDVLFFLALTEVMSNHPIDFETMPMPNSLQLALVVHEFPGEYSDDVKKAVGYLLNEDGYSSLVWPFSAENTDTSLLVGTGNEGDSDREAANRQYIEAMTK